MISEDFSRPRVVPQPAASCLLLNRSHLPAGHLMDERFPIYFNDVQLARSLATEGHLLWMTPEAVVVHERGASTRLLGTAHSRQYIGSLILYLSATEPTYKLVILRTIVLLEYFARAVMRHHGAMPMGDVIGALRGKPGPVPHAAVGRSERA